MTLWKRTFWISLLIAIAMGLTGCGLGGQSRGAQIPAGSYSGSWYGVNGPPGAPQPTGSMSATVDSSGNVSGSLSPSYPFGSSFTGTVNGSGSVSLTLDSGDTASGVLNQKNGNYFGTLSVSGSSVTWSTLGVSLTQQ